MKTWLILTLIVGLSFTGFTADNDVIVKYESLIEEQDYTKALLTLNQQIRKRRRLKPEVLVEILEARAEFYESLVGDYKTALATYRIVPKAKLTEDKAQEIQSNISRLETLLVENKVGAELITKLKKVKGVELVKLTGEVETFIENNPDSIWLAHLNHWLGVCYLENGNNHTAIPFFEKAMVQKPAIRFVYSTQQYRDKAHKQWKSNVFKYASWVIISVLMLVFIPLFYLSRPWEKLAIQHVSILVGMCMLWYAFFTIAAGWAGSSIDLVASRNGADVVTSTPGAALSDSLGILFAYGLVGVMGAFAISCSLLLINKLWIRMILNTVFSFLLFTALAIVFSQRHCPDEFVGDDESISGFWDGHYRFITQEPTPFVLADPQSYPGLDIHGLDEEMLREAILKHYPEEEKKDEK